MRQVRKLSNLIADELEMQGIEVGSKLFESTVSSIVKSVNEALKDADKKDAGNTDVFEEVEEGSFYFATDDTVLGDYEVSQDEIVELVTNGEPCIVNIYDADGELREGEVEVSAEDFVAFVDNADEVVVEDVEELFDDEEEDVEEGAKVSFKGGHKRIISAKQASLLLKSKKKGKGWKVKDGKIVRRTRAEIKASDKNIQKAQHGKGAAKAKKNRNKSLKANKNKNKKKRKANESVVVEGFDISANGTIFHVEDGDVLSYEDGFLTVTRDGVEVFSNLTVSESFVSRCVAEGVVEDCEDCDDEEEIQEAKKRKTVKEDEDSDEDEEEIQEDSDEEDDDEDEDDDKDEDDEDEESEDKEVSESMLTFKSGKGYCLVSEGRELQMGNRIRARAMLLNQGFEVSSEDLDKASSGQVVIL